MLTAKQINEIREHLENAKNPVFYYDNDADGLCSYVLLRRFLGRGKGVAVRSFPDLNASYARKVFELKADYVFVLDKPVLSREFIEEISKANLQIVWIDHHDIEREKFEEEFDNLYVYNSSLGNGGGEPVTYLCYKVTNRKEDVWLAVIGCIADHYLPNFISEFKENYGEFWTRKNVKEPFDAYYGTEIGKIARAINFGLKDSITNVVQLQNFLISCSFPGEVLSESGKNYNFRKKYLEIEKKYNDLINKAEQGVSGRVIFFEYGGEISISSDISNELFYKHSDKFVVVAYKKGEISNLSLRGKNVKKILEKVLKEVGGHGGGHDDAVGARIATSDLGKFKELFHKYLSSSISDKLKV